MKRSNLITLIISVGLLLLLIGRAIYLKVKPGAKIENLTGEMKDALITIGDVFKDAGIEGVITSGTDSKHSVINSYHYTGDAVDLRLASRLDPNANDQDFRDNLKAALGPDFDVVLESDHFHVEYDRKRVASRGAIPGERG